MIQEVRNMAYTYNLAQKNVQHVMESVQNDVIARTFAKICAWDISAY